MPQRSFSSGSYRYGFNGKENDNEVKGQGNQQDYGMRIYDDRLGRFLSVDPLTKTFPWYTPYQYAGNSPISNIDVEGLQPASMIDANGKLTEPVIQVLTNAFRYTQSSLKNTRWINYKSGNATERAWAFMTGVGGKSSASTMNTTIVHDASPSRTDEEWFRLIAHEQFHREDVDATGVFSFYLIYSQEGLQKKYRDIRTEELAYKMGANWGGSDEALGLLNYNNGIFLKVLNDEGLNSSQKSLLSRAIGDSYRAEVVLPKEIKMLEENIETLGISIAALEKNKNLDKEGKQTLSLYKMLHESMKIEKVKFEKEKEQLDAKKIKIK